MKESKGDKTRAQFGRLVTYDRYFERGEPYSECPACDGRRGGWLEFDLAKIVSSRVAGFSLHSSSFPFFFFFFYLCLRFSSGKEKRKDQSECANVHRIQRPFSTCVEREKEKERGRWERTKEKRSMQRPKRGTRRLEIEQGKESRRQRARVGGQARRGCRRGWWGVEKRERSTFGLAAGGGRRTRDIARG